jgi:hypothetical protein
MSVREVLACSVDFLEQLAKEVLAVKVGLSLMCLFPRE